VSVLVVLVLSFGEFDCSLLSVDGELVLPESLDLTSVLLLAHTSLLLCHLLKTFVLSKLLHQLIFKVILETLFFGSTLGLKAHLEIFGLLELTFGVGLLFLSFTLALSSSELVFLNIKLIPEVLSELILGTALHLFTLKFLEDGVSGGLSLVLGILNLVQAELLLFCVLAYHFVFIGLHFCLTFDQGALLILGEDHVSLSLLHL